MVTTNLKEKVKGWRPGDKKRVKLEKKKKEEEAAARRQHDATAARFPDLDNAATSPTTGQSSEPWYSEPKGEGSSEKIEPVRANLSGPFEDKPFLSLNNFSSTQLPRNQELKPGSDSLTSTQIVGFQSNQINLPSIMGRGRFETSPMLMGTGDDPDLKEKMARGILPAKPISPNVRDEDSLREQYSRSEETFAATKITNPSQIVRRPVGAEPTRRRKRSKTSSFFREVPLDDANHGPGNSHPSVPPVSSTQEDPNFKPRRSSEVSNDESVDSRDQVQDYEDDKTSHNPNSEMDEMRGRGKEDSEESSSDEDSSKDSLKDEVQKLREQLKKEARRWARELKRERVQSSVRLEATESTMKAMYEQQLRQGQKENAAEKKAFEDKVKELRGLHDTEEREMESDYKKKLSKAKKIYEKQLTDLELDLEKIKENLKSVSDSRDREIGELKSEHENNIRHATQPLKKEIDSLKEELEKVKREKADEIQNLKGDHEDALRIEKENCTKLLNGMSLALAKLKEEKNAEIEGLIAQHKFEMDNADDKFQQQIQNLQNDLDQLALMKDKEIRTNREAHETEKLRIREDHEKDRKVHEAEKSRMREDHETDRKAHETEKSRMRKEHEADKVNSMRQLKEDLEALKGLLFKRDNFKAMTDNDLEDRFGAIRHEVDEVARVEWNKLYEFKWPFNEQSLHLSKIKRVAKQHLIQNTLWVILYEKIFCTPFRVLGSEGKALEAKWVREFGQDDHSGGVPCPRASKESEKWRYEKIVKCVEAIKQAPAEGYELTLRDVTNHLFFELERVADASDMERQGIDKQRVNELVRSAAKLWLEIGQQRFRTKLIMSESGERPVQSSHNALSHSGTLNIVIFPELRRLGNAQGEQLEHEEVVMGCKGSFSVFRTR